MQEDEVSIRGRLPWGLSGVRAEVSRECRCRDWYVLGIVGWKEERERASRRGVIR